MHAPVVLGLLLFSQVILIIRGSTDDHGFCHLQQLKATFCVHCESDFPYSIAVSIVARENESNGTYELFCLTSQRMCSGSMTRTYNASSDTLEIRFIFNHTIHADRYLRIIRERNGSQENQQILLKPCFSGFTANASFYNESLINVSCQHSSFNYSNTPIRIKIEDGTEYGACSKIGCLGCKNNLPGSLNITTESPNNSTEQGIATSTGSSTSKSITSMDNLPGSLNITTESPNSLSTEQDIVTFTEGQSTSKSITSTNNLQGYLNITKFPNSLSTEQGITTSTKGSKPSQETNGSRTVKEETTTEYLGTTVMQTNAPSNAITIINQNIIDQGFCHQQDVNIKLYFNCGIPFSANINVAKVASKHEIKPNNLLTCRRSNDSMWYCHRSDIMTGKFNSSSCLLNISFKFNFTIHAGYYVRVISSCAGNQETKHVHLIPCFSGFTVNATFYNETLLVINCQHSSFNYSSSPIRIKLKGGNDLGGCSKISCNICKRLPDGIQCFVLYAPESIYQCVLDSAIFNISLPTTQPEIQTTTPQNVSTSQRVTTPSEYTAVSEKSVVTSTDSSSTTSPRIITSSEESTTSILITKTSSEGTTVQTFESTLTENSQTTFSEDHSTTESTTSRPGEISTSQNDIESSLTSRENVESTTSAPHFESTSTQSTKIITTAPIDGESIIIFNKDVLNQGFCHLNGVKIDLNVTCEMQSVAKLDFYVVPNANIFLSCVKNGTWNCHGLGSMTGKYNASFDLLEITLNLNYTVYAGHYLRIIYSCDNIQDAKNIHLKACFSGFTVNTTFYNETFISARCQHSSFNYSSSPIRIKVEGGNDYGACSRNSCNGCTRLPNGIVCKAPYIPGEKLQCILDGAIYNIPVQDMMSPGITTLLQIITTTQHAKTTPQISSTTSTGSSTENLTKVKSTPTTSQKNKPASQNTTITSVEGLTSMTSILTSTFHSSITTKIILATFTGSVTTKSIPKTSIESKTTTITNIPTTSHKRTTSINIPSSSKEGITIATSSPRTSQESITSTSTVISEESITKTTYTLTNPQESLTTTYIPTTTTTGIQETSHKSSTTIPSSSNETIPTRISTNFQERSTTTTYIPTTFKESKTASILTLRDGSTTMTILPTTSQERKTTTTNIPTTLLEILTTTTTQSPTASHDIITTKKIIPTTSQEIITTTIPATSQKGMTTSIQTTFNKITTTTKRKPTTRSITTSTKKIFETPPGNIKSTTPAEKTYGSSGMSVVQRPLINVAVFLIVVANCLKYM